MIDALGAPQALLLLGGTSDIALAIARRYAAVRPVRVVLAARPSERRSAAAAELTAAGCTVTEIDFEARDTDSHAAAMEQAFAGGDIDVAVVAFGLLGDAEQAWTDPAEALRLAEVNYVAPVHVGVLLANKLKHQGHGTIVALSSVAGERVRRSNFVYGSTKAGLDGFYLGLGEALRDSGVRVLVVRPGFVKSKMTEGLEPAPMAVTPEEVAEATVAAVKEKRELIWVPAPMRAVMSGLRHVPRPLFRRLPI
ncbi:decaprenylphospho-beta-D-erythro-pentofuranosid-2 -ulose 2-reductase [Microlunatus panaciterrae]|uniref:Decaprenylphospho-beta-D-erythro-pentofuranosid-2-ulose 2-reductase n=1 Tax=Microlunatus panaciterrae TaxID=400768 RepID=A0ABS2RMK4_9ACTN|nr:decaprenylphospho-beta-D-erythro-pentofuranosid-2-ulose 2-reductase [Microlunatus panaciterrae]MBM7799732.1 decaprenylphospho-beta-D-erythro-pentofuranosid-2-ulose 2-reductase [Microlunatus panaciterrae]